MALKLYPNTENNIQIIIDEKNVLLVTIAFIVISEIFFSFYNILFLTKDEYPMTNGTKKPVEDGSDLMLLAGAAFATAEIVWS